jgi:chromosome segregation ATPase
MSSLSSRESKRSRSRSNSSQKTPDSKKRLINFDPISAYERINRLRSALEDKDMTIVGKNQVIFELKERVEELEVEVRRKDSYIGELKDQIVEFREELRERSDKLNQTLQVLENVNKRNAELVRKLRSMGVDPSVTSNGEDA